MERCLGHRDTSGFERLVCLDIDERRPQALLQQALGQLARVSAYVGHRDARVDQGPDGHLRTVDARRSKAVVRPIADGCTKLRANHIQNAGLHQRQHLPSTEHRRASGQRRALWRIPVDEVHVVRPRRQAAKVNHRLDQRARVAHHLKRRFDR
jgi:hypothetical protein